MYTIEEFDREKTRVLRYILYKKRSEYEVRNKFEKTIEPELLEDIIEYLKEAKYIEDYMYENSEELKEYEIKSASNIIFKKSNSMEKEEIKQYLLKKGYKLENINMAFENK